MPIGRYLVYSKKQDGDIIRQFLRRVYLQLFGTPDLHSHIRWWAVRKILYRWLDTIEKILDIGCGSGMFAFEISNLCKKCRNIVGIDIDGDAITRAKQVADMIHSGIKFDFIQYDATKSIPFGVGDFDLVLLIDVIEHVDDDKKLLREAIQVVRAGGLILISVPTPNYPRVFGREFHESIGHKRDGYWLEDIDNLLSREGVRIIESAYYTYLPAALVCALYYRWLRRRGKVAMLLSPMLRLFTFGDRIWPIREAKYACSLVVLGRKK